jgi:hypothetical protein
MELVIKGIHRVSEVGLRRLNVRFFELKIHRFINRFPVKFGKLLCQFL